MSRISSKLYQEIQEFLLGLNQIHLEEDRKQIGRDAAFPEHLLNLIAWGEQPSQTFVSYLIDRTLEWGLLSVGDTRQALVEYIIAAGKIGDEEHRQRLALLTERLSDEINTGGIGGSEFSVIPEVKFVNRELEIRDLTNELSLSPRYALHAPAGYGKTWLLWRIRDEYSKHGWITYQAVIDKETSIVTLNNSLLDQAGLSETSGTESADIPELAAQLAEEIKFRWQAADGSPKGIVFLIDLSDLPAETIFFDIIKGWLPVVFRNIYRLPFFSQEKNRLRIIVSGRFFSPVIQRLFQYGEVQIRFNVLSPLTERVLERSVDEYLPDLDPEWRVKLWTGLFHFTGGHPGCASQILNLYWQKSLTEPEQFYSESAEEIQDMVLNGVNTILHDFPDTTRELLLALSPFRYLSYGILDDVLKQRPKIVEWMYRSKDLADFLTRTQIVTWDESGYLLRDGVARRVMSLHIRYSDDQSLLYIRRCTQARALYRNRLADDWDPVPPSRWAIEYLYQSLQMKISMLETAEGRSKLRQSFWGTSDMVPPQPHSDLYDCLSSLIHGRDERVQIEALQAALSDDSEWEFRFTLNYFLRDEVYETKWLDILLAKVQAFLAERM